jgi:hypothetical protein
MEIPPRDVLSKIFAFHHDRNRHDRMLSHERTDRSLMGSVTTVHPTVTVVEGDDWIRARAWRDTSFEAQKAVNICVHLIVASVGVKPGNFAIRLDGVCGAEGSDSATEEQVLYNTTCSISKSLSVLAGLGQPQAYRAFACIGCSRARWLCLRVQRLGSTRRTCSTSTMTYQLS